MRKPITILLLVLGFSIHSKAQISFEDVSLITITDEINYNYEVIKTHNFEVRFNGTAELWNINQVSKNEFLETIFKQQWDSLSSVLWRKRRENNVNTDSLRTIHSNNIQLLDQAYINYCDTVKAQFIKSIPKDIINDLLTAVQDHDFNEDDLKEQINSNTNTSYGNKIEMTSFYPLVGMTIYSTKRDSLVIYNNGQQDLTLPWREKSSNIELYNPLINWSLDSILPDNLTYNKKRLTRGLKK